jgi:hypothetical protein
MKDLVENLNLETIAEVIAVITVPLGILQFFHKKKIESLDDLHQKEILELKSEHNKMHVDLRDQLNKERDAFKLSSLENNSKQKASQADVPLKQELKLVYVKYLHIHKEGQPVYKKFIERLGETIDVCSEINYYSLNKFNTSDNSITLTNRSTGVVDYPYIIYPWKKVEFTDLPSIKVKGILAQEVCNSDTYFSCATYYNGFNPTNEDVGMKMEMDTECARIVADFSSIIAYKKLLIKPPDLYKSGPDQNKTKLFGLEEISDGIYHFVAYNLKKGDTLTMCFHVDWDYMDKN